MGSDGQKDYGAGGPENISSTEYVDANDPLSGQSVAAAGLLKSLSHEARLRILCYLSQREHSVTELELLLQTRQSAVSQHLARLRGDGIVTFRREGKAIFYGIHDQRAVSVVAEVMRLFARPQD